MGEGESLPLCLLERRTLMRFFQLVVETAIAAVVTVFVTKAAEKVVEKFTE